MKRSVLINKKQIIRAILAAVMAVLCIFTIIKCEKSFDFVLLAKDMKAANPFFLTGALLGTAGFIFWEGCAIRVIANGISKGAVKGTGFIYAASDVYFSAITPSASGGQPASLYFLLKDGLSLSLAGLVLLINLVMYTLALMVVGLVCVLIHPEIIFALPLPAKLMICFGYIVTLFLAEIFWMLIFKKELIDKIGSRTIHLLNKLKIIRNSSSCEEKLHQTVNEYESCAASIKGKHRMLIRAFICNLLQRVAQVSVLPFCYLALGGSVDKFLNLFCVQGIAAVGCNSIPIPGAMGAADYLIIQGLNVVNVVYHTANLELLSRGIAFYLCIIFCGIYTFIAYLHKKKSIHGI